MIKIFRAKIAYSVQSVAGLNIVKKYLINIEAHFVGYLYIMDLINAQKMDHTKILEGLHLIQVRKYKITNFFHLQLMRVQNGDIHHTKHM